MQCFDMQKPFARKRAHAKQILIQIRRAVAVGVNAALACKHGMKRRAFFCLRQWRDHARLQNAVASRNAPAGRVNVRCIQRVCGDRHQLAQGSGRQASVAVEGHNVLDVTTQMHAIGKIKRTFVWFVFIVSCGNQLHQRFQLAPLAFPAYPLAFSGAPFTPPVDDQKTRRLPVSRGVGRIELTHLRQRFSE